MKELLNELVNKKQELNAKIDSIVIEQKDGVVSHIFNEINLHELRSCSKLLVAFSFGILIEKGELSLDTKVYDILKPLIKNIDSENENKIKQWTIRTLLTHSTGYPTMMLNEKWLEQHDEREVFNILFNTPIENTINKDYTYSNVEPYLCSVIYQEMFKENLSDFVKREIFDKLEISSYEWKKYNGYTLGATGLYLNYKDFHKIAKLLMNYGKYESKQIIPEHWVKEMTKPQIECPKYYKPTRVFPKVAAGYFTFISKDNIVFRDGSHGQYIICDHGKNRLITIMATDDEMTKETEIFRGVYDRY